MPKNNNLRPNAVKVAEKSKNLKVTLNKLMIYLKKYSIAIVVALILAILSSIFSIIGPNKISDLTNEISDGLVINKENFTYLTEDVFSNISEEKIKEISNKLLNLKIDNETIKSINNSKTISSSDKLLFNKFLKEFSLSTNPLTLVLDLPEQVKNIILPKEVYNDVEISTADKIAFITCITSFNSENDDNEKINFVTSFPTSIKQVLFPTSTYKNVSITTSDKIKFIEVMSKIKDKDNVNEIYQAIDLMPKSIKNLVKPTMNLKTIKNISLFLLVLYLVSALFNFLQSYIMATVSNNFSKELRNKISHKINNLPLKYFDNHSYGDILSRVTNDVDTIGTSMYQSLGSLIGAITLFIGSIIMMFVTNGLMAITAIISSLIGFVFMFIILGKSQKYFTARQVELGKLNGHIEEIYSSHNVVKAYNGEEDASKKFDKYNESVYICNKKSQFLSGLMGPMMNFIGNLGYVCVCIVGAFLVIKGNITFGVIIAFIIYVRLFTSPLSQIAQGMTSLQSTTAASERVFEFIEEQEMEDESKLVKVLNPKNAKGNITFEHVKFGYDYEKIVIKDFSCNVLPGQKIAIVGPTGAGKTTMVNLLMKFYNIDSGDIKIDNISIKDLTRDNIHQLFIMVLQDTWLFNGTIRDNIKYNKENVSDKEIWNALKVVGVDHFVKSLPGGLDYEFNDNESISAGQKQLLTIARGMIEDSPFLILDEATSSVDTRTEELVQKAMDKLTEGRTSFIIAHRLSTIKNADIILVMKDGNIIEQGNHEDLLQKNGFYAELYNSQFQDMD